MLEGEAGDDIWSLLMLTARLEESNAQAAASAEPAFLAKYTFNLARAFNLFYHRHRIIAEENEVKRAVLIAVGIDKSGPGFIQIEKLGKVVPMAAREQYVVDAKGRKTAVLLSLEQYERLLEDLHDLAVVAERRDEEPISLKELKRRLKKDGLI